MFQDSSVVAEVHAGVKVRLRPTGADSGSLTVVVDVPEVSGDSPWWVSDPNLELYLYGLGPSFDVATFSVADVTGEGAVHSESAGPSAINGRAFSAATVDFGKVANGSSVAAEFDVAIVGEPQPGHAFAFLRILHSFGTRRIDGAESLGAGISLLAEVLDGRTSVRLAKPTYWVNVDEGEDCDPSIDPDCEEEAPQIIYHLETQLVSSVGGPCTPAWCLEAAGSETQVV